MTSNGLSGATFTSTPARAVCEVLAEQLALGDGIFTPAVAGPNPERRFSTNNAGDLTVTGTALGLTGEGHLIVTVQRWNDPPIR